MRTSHTAEGSKGREKLLSRAASVVAIRGEFNLNFAEVAAAAGVSEDVVRAEFGSFESLKDALVDRLDGMVMECVNQEFASLPEAATPMEKIIAFAHGYLAFAERHTSDFAAHMGIDASGTIYEASGASYDQAVGLLFPREPYRLVGSLVKELMQWGYPRVVDT